MSNVFENKKAFEILFKEHYPKLCRIAKGYIKNEAVVEEIVCEIFIKLWNNRDKLVIKSSLPDYLIKSVQNACIDYYRKEKLHIEQTVNFEDNLIVCSTLADLDEDPLDYLINDEQQKKILEAIEQLPERYKMTFKLCRLEEMSYEETAQIMGITKNTVKSNLREGLTLLRKSLKDVIILFILLMILL